MKIKKVSGTAVLNGNVVDNLTDNSTENAPSQRAVNEEFIKVKGKILWTNPNPTINFNGQNVNLLDSDWDSYEVIYSVNTSSDSMLMSSKSIKGRGCKLNSKVDANDICDREIQYKSQELLHINGAYINNNARNEYLIPLYIIGYKTGLFS